MGQKVNPNTFRLGYSKISDSKWATNFKNFSRLLQEDYEIRKYFEAFFQNYSIYTRGVRTGEARRISSRTNIGRNLKPIIKTAFITKLEIRRLIDNVDLIIHCAKPSIFNLYKGKNNPLNIFRTTVRPIILCATLINMQVRLLRKPEFEIVLLMRYLKKLLVIAFKQRRALTRMCRLLGPSKINVTGYKIELAGRVDGKERKRLVRYNGGCVPVHTLRALLQYISEPFHTRSGVLGIKFWVFAGLELGIKYTVSTKILKK